MHLYINFSSYLIQQIRLIHALAETKHKIVLPESEKEKYHVLTREFKKDFLYGTNWDYDITEFIIVNHTEPLTSVFGIERPLIFPHAITDYCGALWKGERQYRFSFAGLLTKKRNEVIEHWLETKFGRKITKKNQDTFFELAQAKLLNLLGIRQNNVKTKIGDLFLWSSIRGREFPIKSWDREYYKVLSDSEFVLCPNGDYIWTYRFFESVLCGAIPVVESDCKLYKGFRYFTMEENPGKFKWREEDAVHNYSLCIRTITVPIDLLNNKIEEFAEKSPRLSVGKQQ